MTHFPVLLKLGSSVGITDKDITSIFDEVGANSQKIAITKDDEETQIYCEIERWDSENEVAELWVSKSDLVIDDDTDTDLYIYYDSTKADNTTYVGTVNSTPGAAVWDSNFLAVYHLSETGSNPQVLDSTGNNYDSTANLADPSTSGKIDGCMDYESGNSDSTTFGDVLDYPGTYLSAEAWVKAESWPSAVINVIISKYSKSAGNGWELCTDSGDTVDTRVNFNGNSYYNSANDIAKATDYHLGFSYDSTDTSGKLIIYRNGAVNKTNTSVTAPSTNDYNFYIGRENDGYYWDGLIDEVRISNVARPGAYWKATYNTCLDALVSWGDEERGKQTYSVTVSDAFTLTDTKKPKTKFGKSFSDVFNISDLASKIARFGRIIADGFSLSDIASFPQRIFITISDALDIADETARKIILTITNEINISDIISRFSAFTKTITDTITQSDVVVFLKRFFISVSDEIGLTDAFTKLYKAIKSIADDILLVDTISKLSRFAKSVLDEIGLVDVIDTFRKMLVFVLDTISPTDVASKIARFGKTIADTITHIDLSSVGLFFKKTISDAFELMDSIVIFKRFILAVVDTISFSDVVSKANQFAKTISDTLRITDITHIVSSAWTWAIKHSSTWTYQDKSESSPTWDWQKKSERK